MHIAIVDDEESVRRALARVLSAYSFNIEIFNSAIDFATSLRMHEFACLILDLHMPDISGFELQQHLHRVGVTIPTIIITADKEIGARQRCLAAGAASFLVKPLDSEELIDAIKRATAPLNGNDRNSKSA